MQRLENTSVLIKNKRHQAVLVILFQLNKLCAVPVSPSAMQELSDAVGSLASAAPEQAAVSYVGSLSACLWSRVSFC